jgi:hypothetical protein
LDGAFLLRRVDSEADAETDYAEYYLSVSSAGTILHRAIIEDEEVRVRDCEMSF